MIAKPSLINEGNIEFYMEAKVVEAPLGEFSKQQLEKAIEALQNQLTIYEEMLTHFN